jgi:Arc/MetJ-type ribon-helix-helix transcriptional regulator
MSFTVHLPDDLLAFAEAEVTAGHYASVADVCAAGLRLLKKRNTRPPRLVRTRRPGTSFPGMRGLPDSAQSSGITTGMACRPLRR